ncbi:MAG TPA: 6-phosphogluconolactonase [Bryobacteraceae bacterium]|nr:6-phosphogluconolactonase [Bryobacteraceae bacterium]
MNAPLAQFQRDRLSVIVCENKAAAGEQSAAAAAQLIQAAVENRGKAAVIFASAVSQDYFLAALRVDPRVDWTRVTAFHLDEYVGMEAGHEQSFRRYLHEHLFRFVKIGQFHGLRGEADDLEFECARYSGLLRDHAPDLVVLGIGENGHLAFIDPPLCDFNDPKDVRVVELDRDCRQQQVNDGAFPTIEDVPGQALSLTVPYFLRVPAAVITTGGPRKRNAVTRALDGPIEESCPASALRLHLNAQLFCDGESYPGYKSA